MRVCGGGGGGGRGGEGRAGVHVPHCARCGCGCGGRWGACATLREVWVCGGGALGGVCLSALVG